MVKISKKPFMKRALASGKRAWKYSSKYVRPAAALGMGLLRGKRSFGTQTMTKTKRKKSKVNNVKRVQDIGFTVHSLYKKGSEVTIKRWMKDGIHAKYKFTGSASFLSLNGLQLVSAPPVTVASRADIDTVNQKVVDAVVTGTTAVQGFSAIRKIDTVIQMKNQTNDEVEVWLYWIGCKKDIPTGASLPIVAWDLGSDDQLGTAGTPVDYPYADPRESGIFNETYYVHRKTLYRMKSGALVTDTFHYYPNRIISEGYLQRFTGIQGYKGLTFYPILVQLGPIGRKTIAPVNPTYGPCRLDVICSIFYDMYGHADKRLLMTNVNGVDQTAGLINAMTDADETVNNIITT